MDPFLKCVGLPIMWATLATIALGAFAAHWILGVLVTWLVVLIGAGLQLQMSQEPHQPL